jgi:hypothetical protein
VHTRAGRTYREPYQLRDTVKVIVRWALVIWILVGCAGPLQPGQVPTAEERCAMVRGSFRGGVCHTIGGA